MEIKNHITEEDFLNFNLFHMKNSKTARRALNIQRFLTPICFLFFAYFISEVTDISFLLAFSIFLIASILWVLFFPKYFYSHVIRHVKKMIKEGKNEGLLGDHTLVMTEEGVVDSTLNGETKVNWSGIKSLKEDNHYFYLYNSSVSAYILPKRDLKNIEEIKKYLTSKIKD